MRYLLLLSILFYQKFWFSHKKGNGCLFKESCSNYVYRICRNQGFIEGLKALVKRFMECRSGHIIFKEGDGCKMITKNNTVYAQNHINPDIFQTISETKSHV